MPSPFPGMDPWLEAPDLWPGVHNELIVQLRHLLVPQLRPDYFVDLEKRVYVLDEDDPGQRLVVPDVTVAVGPRAHAGASSVTQAAGGARPTELLMASEVEVREPRLVVRTARGREVVAVVELLSPTNKLGPGSRGRQEYLEKRRELLRSPAHLVELDLLRAGRSIPSVDPLPPGDYRAHVSRAERRPRGEVWAWGLRDPLPRLPLPLRGRDAELDLGLALARAYDEGGYDVALDYARPPVPALVPEDARWAADLVAAREPGPS